MGMMETSGRATARGAAVHEVAAILEVLLDEMRRGDVPFLAYLLEIALDEASAVAAGVPEQRDAPRLPASRISTAAEAARRHPSPRRDAATVQPTRA